VSPVHNRQRAPFLHLLHVEVGISADRKGYGQGVAAARFHVEQAVNTHHALVDRRRQYGLDNFRPATWIDRRDLGL
jgi:hypothetical protein